MLTFRDYLSIINEDASTEVMALQTKISQLQAKISQATQPLQRQLQQLQTLLAQKQKQAEVEGKAQAAKMKQSTLTTPGSAGATQPGAGTPGV